ncbi:MAG: hypothetical protein KJ954_14335 [Alphaproteobacteria bacterium]|nr:hypothetical protein [Alphaproteobacteria bacterium]
MNYRRSLLLSPVDVDAAGTKVIDLNFPDVISRIMIKFDVTNPASVTIQEVPAANIPKIEIVDGSNVIFSLTGMQTHALDFLDTGRQYICGGSYVPAWALSAILMINFGRFLFDPVLAFDPKKFTNPQLKITFDEDVAVANAVTNSLTVFADIFDEKVAAPTGFLMNKELYDYVPVADSTEEIDLPNDYTFRKLILQARVADLWFGGIIGNLKLSEDNDRKIPFDLTGSQLENYVHERFGEYRDGIIADLNTITGVDIYHAPTQGVKMRGDFYCISDVVADVPFGYRNKYACTTNTGSSVMDIAGTIPHGCICIPFGDQNDPADWYVPGTKNLKLKIKAGTGKTFTETFHVLTQQVRNY